MVAVVVSAICPLMSQPNDQCERADEALHGMVLEVLEETLPGGWYRVRTPYRYEGYVSCEHLLFGEEHAARWADAAKQEVIKGFCDVLAGPSVCCYALDTLPRGAQVIANGKPDESGWVQVTLADGRQGYTKQSFLQPHCDAPRYAEEAALRRAVTETAKLYLGTHYRWGGKTPMGIDCSGLVSMAYWLNGVTIWRDASIKEGFPLHEIPREAMQPGDPLFFPGHVAMYLGDGKYIHSTAKNGSDGVVINSLNPADPDYREDLDKGMTAVGSLF